MAVTVVSVAGVPAAQVISPVPGRAYQPAGTQLVVTAPAVVRVGDLLTGAAAVGLTAQGVAKKIATVGGASTLGPGTWAAGRRKVTQAGLVGLGVEGEAAPVGHPAGSFSHITVTRDYNLATGDSPSGFVYFTPSTWLVNNKVTLGPAPVTAALDSLGQISISLVANNDPGTVPPASFYTVREAILGQPTRTYKVAIPYNATNATVDLSTLPVLP